MAIIDYKLKKKTYFLGPKFVLHNVICHIKSVSLFKYY